MTEYAQTLLARWRGSDDRSRLLQVVQPGLVGLIDGTISTLAPVFASAYIAGSRAALLVGLAAAFGAAISMGLSEGLSDDGQLTGRGSSLVRGLITGTATFVGGTFHTLPFLARDVHTALGFTYLDSGAMYRSVALAVRERDGRPAEVARAADIGVGDRVVLDGRDVTEAIRAPEVSEVASRVAADPGVREALVAKQRALLRGGD